MVTLAKRLQNRLGFSIRTLLSGSPTRKFVPDPQRPGIFPADGAAYRIHAEASMMIGGIRALLLQTLHPVAMYAVSEHSEFRSDPLARLRRTVYFLGTTTYGNAAQADAALERVKRIHESVIGVTPEGVPYNASDPHLLAWVHATEVDSFLTTYRLYSRRQRASDLAAAEADAYTAEMAVIAEELGVHEPPRSASELQNVLESFRPELADTPLSREATEFLRNFPFRRGARVAYTLLFAAAADSLPDWAKELHGFKTRKASGIPLRAAARLLLRALDWALKGADDPKVDSPALSGEEPALSGEDEGEDDTAGRACQGGQRAATRR